MDDLQQKRDAVEKYIREGRNEEAIKAILALIALYAQKHDFSRAESLREKIIAIDPMALSEVLLAQDIIDTARAKPVSRNHREVWDELYLRLTPEEATALQNELEGIVFKPGQTIFAQGRKNSNLYFIDSGQAKHIFKQGNRELFINKIGAANLANSESFFDASLCTTSLVAIDQVKAHCLNAMTLLSWEGYLPALEGKLRDFCARGEKIHDLLQKSSQDRRVQRRLPLPGRILLKIVDATGNVIGRTIRGELSDVSLGGASFFVHTTTREQAQTLLGHNLHLRFNIPPSAEVNQLGTVLGVKHYREGIETKERYSVHVKFRAMLTEQALQEAERFIRMMKINRQNR